MKTTTILGILSFCELAVTGGMFWSVALWFGYGIYKLD